jgi:hypothetical protein
MFTELNQIFPAERGVYFSIMVAKNVAQKIVLIYGICEPQLYCTDAVQTRFQLLDVCVEWIMYHDSCISVLGVT